MRQGAGRIADLSPSLGSAGEEQMEEEEQKEQKEQKEEGQEEQKEEQKAACTSKDPVANPTTRSISRAPPLLELEPLRARFRPLVFPPPWPTWAREVTAQG